MQSVEKYRTNEGTKLLGEIASVWRNLLGERGFQERSEQLRMMEIIAAQLLDSDSNEQHKRICVVEAPTGTGKTIAYLIPTLLAAKKLNRQVVVATSTIVLQHQLMEEELPALARHIDISYALVKGRSHYACNARLPSLTDASADRQMAAQLQHQLDSRQWDGDISELELTAADSRLLTITREQCQKQQCAYYDNCYYYNSLKRVRETDCIVVNHSMLLSDLKLGGGELLPKPENSLYVIDEAHMLARHLYSNYLLVSPVAENGEWLEKCRSEFDPSDQQREILFSDSNKLPELRDCLTALGDRNSMLMGVVQRYYQQIPPASNSFRFRLRDGLPSELCELGREFVENYRQLVTLLKNFIEPAAESQSKIAAMLARTENEVDFWDAVVRFGDKTEDAESWLFWLEYSGSAYNCQMHARPLVAAPILSRQLWERCAGATLTSATLAVAGDFTRMTTELGLADAATHQLPYQFNYNKAAEIWIPDDFAPPGNIALHTRQIVQLLKQLLPLSDGGNLVLFASHQQLSEVVSSLQPDFSDQLLVQGDAPISKLVARHREKIRRGKNSTLLGSVSFAEGLNLPGKYCTRVFVSKLFFGSPGDPVEEGLREQIENRGGDYFLETALPDAILRLIQATGRLLRSESDTGSIVVLDSRLFRRSYGKKILSALPPYRISRQAAFTSDID